jgi:hypothetical protein
MSFILKGSQISALQGWRVGSNPRRQSKNIEIVYKKSYETCAWIIWCMFPIQCEESSINHLTSLLAVTMPYIHLLVLVVGRFRLYQRFQVTSSFFQFGVAFWKSVLREVYFERPNRVWRALKTSILNIDSNPVLVASDWNESIPKLGRRRVCIVLPM